MSSYIDEAQLEIVTVDYLRELRYAMVRINLDAREENTEEGMG